MINIICQDLNHQMPLISVCLNTECKLKRLCCHHCEIEYHKEHPYQLVDLNLMSYFVQHKYIYHFESYYLEQRQVLNQIKDLIDNLQDGVDVELLRNIQQKYIKEYNFFQQESQYQNHFVEDILKLFRLKNRKSTTKPIWNEKSAKILKMIEKDIQKIIESSDYNQKQLYIQDPIEIKSNLSQIKHISQDGTLIAESGNQTIKLTEVRTKKQIWKIKNTRYVQSIVLSPNNQYLAIGIEIEVGKQYCIHIYHLKQTQIYWMFIAHKYFIESIVFSQDMQYLFTGGDDSSLKIWSLVLKKQIQRFYTFQGIQNIVISPCTKLISCITRERGYLYIWNLQQKKELIKKYSTGHDFAQSLCSSKDSSIYISGGDLLIKLWNLVISNDDQHSTLTLIKAIQICDGFNKVCKVIFTTDEKFIISILSNEDIMIHEIESSKRLQVLKQKLPKPNHSKYTLPNPLISIQQDMNLVTCLGCNLNIWKREGI